MMSGSGGGSSSSSRDISVQSMSSTSSKHEQYKSKYTDSDRQTDSDERSSYSTGILEEGRLSTGATTRVVHTRIADDLSDGKNLSIGFGGNETGGNKGGSGSKDPTSGVCCSDLDSGRKSNLRSYRLGNGS